MPYTKNPYLPRVRARAVDMVRSGKSVRETARYFGVSIGTISKWNKKYPKDGAWEIPTKSSRPKSHPNEIDKEVVEKIIARRRAHGRCAEFIHRELTKEGVAVSLNSVKRTLDRHYLTNKRSYHRRPNPSPDRPEIANPGALVQIDTIHIWQEGKPLIYIYTLLDVYSRWAYAWAYNSANTLSSIDFIKRAKQQTPFLFKMVQSDNGSEFSRQFSDRIKTTHRHSRVRRPNDNAHLERFNRTIQQELLNKLPKDINAINKALPDYLKFYNEERFHLGINLQTPLELTQKCFQAIG